jgi:hypothetical protein
MNAPFPYIGKVKTVGRKLINQLMVTKESGAPARSLDRRLQKARAAWFREMEHFKDSEGCILLPDDAPMLTDDALKNCQMLPYREAILERMKKDGIAAEVGVQAGYFSENILRICQPKRLHLLDLYLQKYRIAEKFKGQGCREHGATARRRFRHPVTGFPTMGILILFISMRTIPTKA